MCSSDLTGSTPFAVYPRLVAAPGAPVEYGFTITPDQLPTPYTTSGQKIFANLYCATAFHTIARPIVCTEPTGSVPPRLD